MAGTDAVILLSGGIDSTTAAAIAIQQGYQLHALTFCYGQRHQREIESAKRVASFLPAKTHRVIEFDLRSIGGSALTDQIAVPKGRNDQEIADGIPITYVPARNTIFLSFGLALAERVGAADIFFFLAPTNSTTAAIRTAAKNISRLSKTWPTLPPKPESKARPD
jgi:7-cyano-7-deazaguanine synthase